jgi:hypothetical protein
VKFSFFHRVRHFAVDRVGPGKKPRKSIRKL